MSNSVLSSTFFLTILLMIGLFFFIRAAVKDRTQQLILTSKLPEEKILIQLQNYFAARAYQVKAVDAATNQVTFEGFVRPSWLLALLLSILAFFGLLSLSLVISLLFPNISQYTFILIVIAPVAGIFYWQNAGRFEQVFLTVTPQKNQDDEIETKIAVTAHRDELIEFKKSMQF